METIIIIMAIIGTFVSAIFVAGLISLVISFLSDDNEKKSNNIQFATYGDAEKEISDKWKEWMKLNRRYMVLPSQARLNIAKKMTNDLSDEIGKYENK